MLGAHAKNGTQSHLDTVLLQNDKQRNEDIHNGYHEVLNPILEKKIIWITKKEMPTVKKLQSGIRKSPLLLHHERVCKG